MTDREVQNRREVALEVALETAKQLSKREDTIEDVLKNAKKIERFLQYGDWSPEQAARMNL